MAIPKCTTVVQYNNEKVSLLSWTSDMDAWSFSLPAGQPGSCPGMVADTTDHICHGCYAQINRYNMPNVLKAQWVRFNWLRSNLKTDHGKEIIINTLVNAIKKYATNGYFRWFDSGDIFSPDMAECLVEICRQTPEVKHWFPTRSWTLFKEFKSSSKINR